MSNSVQACRFASRRVSLAALVSLATTACLEKDVSAQWLPDYQHYTVQRLGLIGPEYTRTDGWHSSHTEFTTEGRPIVGVTLLAHIGGKDAWVWNGASSIRIGLTDAAHVGSAGKRESDPMRQNASGHVIGITMRYSGEDEARGQDAWIWDGTTTHQIGLVGGVYLGGADYQSSTPYQLGASGQVTGTSTRYITGTTGARDTWLWNGSSTVHVGLTGGANTGSSGHQDSTPLALTATGTVFGKARRFTGVNSDNGQDVWVWNGSTTFRLGLTGADYTTSSGYQFGELRDVLADDRVIGVARRYPAPQNQISQDVWYWDGNQTSVVNPTDAEYTGSAGYRYGETWRYSSGRLIGTIKRITGVSGSNGWDIWVWRDAATEVIGLFGPEYTGALGLRTNTPTDDTTTGYLAGTSARYLSDSTPNGQDAWIWDGTTMREVGLRTAAHTGSSGFRKSTVGHLNDAGRATGESDRVLGESTSNGRNGWVWDGVSTRQVGLAGAAHTGSTGYQYTTASSVLFPNGVTSGTSRRIVGVNTQNGEDAWVWNGSETIQIGLIGGVYTGSGGYQLSRIITRSESGKVLGNSVRVSGANTHIGQDAWLWNGNTTVLVGPTDDMHTGDNGYRLSYARILSQGGRVVGYAERRLSNGTFDPGCQDVWYYDPSTGITHTVVGSVQPSTNYAYSVPRLLTDEGVLFGNYTHFSGSTGESENRAFAFRPDLGFIDLGSLVAGGLDASGWAALFQPEKAYGVKTIIGWGFASGQTEGGSLYLISSVQGACCTGVTCVVVDHTMCIGAGRRFSGGGTACNPPGNFAAPCCRSDFDQNGISSIDDLLLYLNAWFTGSTGADVNGVDGTTIDDLFLYLNMWFTGC